VDKHRPKVQAYSTTSVDNFLSCICSFVVFFNPSVTIIILVYGGDKCMPTDKFRHIVNVKKKIKNEEAMSATQHHRKTESAIADIHV